MKEQSLFMQFLGDNAVIRILDFLIESKGEELTKKQIAEGAEISRATLFQHWPLIEKQEIVRVTRSFGKTRLFTLNSKNPAVKKLFELEYTLISQFLESKKIALHATH